jgi:hypothetical protein
MFERFRPLLFHSKPENGNVSRSEMIIFINFFSYLFFNMKESTYTIVCHKVVKVALWFWVSNFPPSMIKLKENWGERREG